MAQEKEDIRDYNLTEEQKAIKAKYPPVLRKYEYLDHTADVQLHAWGDTLEEAFEQCAMAMFGYMTDTGTVEPLQTLEVETQGDDLQSLLFHFLDEWLYKFSADEFFIPREVKPYSILSSSTEVFVATTRICKVAASSHIRDRRLPLGGAKYRYSMLNLT
ncbi:protein archease isoform X2 [Suricata suricatta]|uniref:protein archease isoform X2 n=1 Tax=Suricata suricatta TaxID=37032 RepID=UPI001155DDDA|nr:protein archease isoform X2 [Suricata suricatta]